LRRKKEFRYVYNRGKSIATKNIVLIYCKKKTDGLKIGFSVSKKIGKSVVRNKMRRRLKESVRLNLFDIDKKNLLIFIARTPIKEATYAQIFADVKYLIKKAVPNKNEKIDDLTH